MEQLLSGIFGGTVGSRTFWGNVAVWALWAVANAHGIPLPVEAALVAGGGVAVKETARRWAPAPQPPAQPAAAPPPPRTGGTPPAAMGLLLAVVALAATMSCVSTPDGGKASPVVAVATLSNGVDGQDVVADVRTNYDVTVVRAVLYGTVGLRDGYTGAWLYPPIPVLPGKVLVYRRSPEFAGKYEPGEPLPAWVATSPGLWRPGEAEALGYTFATE